MQSRVYVFISLHIGYICAMEEGIFRGHTKIWWFPEMGVPQSSSIAMDFFSINQPFWGSPLMETPIYSSLYVTIWLSHICLQLGESYYNYVPIKTSQISAALLPFHMIGFLGENFTHSYPNVCFLSDKKDPPKIDIFSLD